VTTAAPKWRANTRPPNALSSVRSNCVVVRPFDTNARYARFQSAIVHDPDAWTPVCCFGTAPWTRKVGSMSEMFVGVPWSTFQMPHGVRK
jgi:hypothetical protein